MDFLCVMRWPLQLAHVRFVYGYRYDGYDERKAARAMDEMLLIEDDLLNEEDSRRHEDDEVNHLL